MTRLPILILALAASVSAIAQEPSAVARLRHNPFAARPSPGAGAGEPGSVEAWRPILRATLVSESLKLANLGGVLLEIGDQAHGYTLLDVGEGLAHFRTGDRVIALRVPGGRQP